LIVAIATADLRQVWREPLLVLLVFMPLLIAFLYRFVLPDPAQLLGLARGPLDPELERHRALLLKLAEASGPVLMAIFIGMAPGMVGGVFGLLLADERDERTLSVVRVMPARFARVLAVRLAVPCILSLVVTVASYPIAGLAPLSMTTVAVIATGGILLAPLTALAIGAFAANKVTALALLRVISAIGVLPVLTWFVSPAEARLAWPVPAYWQMKAFWLALEGRPFGWTLLLCPAIAALLVLGLYHRFERRSEK
jgi:hypothetical protein